MVIVSNRLNSTTAFKQILEKKHDAAWMGYSTGLRPAFWQHYHSKNANKPQTNNITNTSDPELDRMITAYRDSLETKERIELSKKIQGFMDMVGYLAIGQEGEKISRRLYVSPSPKGKYDAKHRYQAFKGEFFQEPTIKSILFETKLADKDGAPLS